jgi:Tol biopolymer transport system component
VPSGDQSGCTTSPARSASLADGSGVKRLTRYTGGEHGKNAFAGSYSPDGKRIVFRFEQRDKGALATVDPNGRHVRLLTKLSKNKPRFIDWGTAP